MKFVMKPDPRHCKFAARIIACSKDAEDSCNQIMDVSDIIIRGLLMHANPHVFVFRQLIAEGLENADPELRVGHIAVLKEFALRAPDAFEQKSDVITAFLLNKVLLVEESSDPVSGLIPIWYLILNY